MAMKSCARRRCALFVFLVIAAAGLISATDAQAEQVVFTIDPLESSLFGDMYGVPIDQYAMSQSTEVDSRLSTYSGTITVDVDDPASPTTIEFITAAADSAITGDWLPEVGGGSEGDPNVDGDADPGMAMPADYGWWLDVGAIGQLYGAARDTVYTLTDPPNTVTAGEFSVLDITVGLSSGFFDQNVSSVFFGDTADRDEFSMPDPDDPPVLNRADAAGTYEVVDHTATLTIPMDFIIGEGSDSVEVTMTGVFVATADLVQRLEADFNDDGAVDGDDFLVWQTGFNQFPNADATQDDGDANTDGFVNGDDFLVWQQQFGSGGASGAVPEPASLALLAAMALAAASMRKRLG